MDDLLACRICLIMDVKMYNLRNRPLDNYFESAFGVNPHMTHELLTYVCAECAVLVKKYYMFREKSFRGLNILKNFLDNNKFTKKDLQSIDRREFKLSSTICSAVPQSIYVFHCTSCPGVEPEHTAFIKEEPLDQNGDVGREYSDDDNSSTLKQIKIEMNEIRESSVKTETREGKKQKDKNKIKKAKKPVPIKVKKNQKFQKCDNSQKPRGPKSRYSKAGPNTHRTKIVTSLDKEISLHFEVIARTLEEQKEEIRSRENTVSYQRSSLKCTICFKAFVQQNAYQLHMRKHDPSAGDIACEVCGFRFRSHGILHRHQLLHTHRFICKTCRQVCSTRNEAKVHRIWHSGVTFECKYCLENFSHRSSYFSHLRLKHPSQYICNMCGYSYLSEAGRKQHKSVMHRDQMEQPLTGPVCDKCDIQFFDQEAFDRHLANSSNHIVSSDFSTACRECGLVFKEPHELKRHQRKEHPSAKRLMEWKYADSGSPKWPKKCDYCELVMENGRENWYHHQREHREEPYSHTLLRHYVCEVCGQTFEKSGVLRDHLKEKHSAERPHACPQCDKTFGAARRLRHHLLSHSQQRPFVCGLCRKPFKTASHLQRHEKIHTGLRPYSCKYCNKTFGTTTARNLHIRSVHYKIPPPVSKRKLLTRGLKGGE